MGRLKIKYPVFRHAPSVIFGRGAVRSLGEEREDGTTVFLLSASESVRRYLSHALERASGRMLTEGNSLTKPAGEPTISSIRSGAAFLADRCVQRIVAVGGGSVLDWARLAWAEAAGGIDLDSSELSQIARQKRPEFWLVPTTCGTGAEAADVVVYTDDAGCKQSLVSPVFAADRVILDSGFVDGIAAADLSAFVSDALSHGMEAYLSIVQNGLAEAAAVSALEMIIEHYAPEPSHGQQSRLMEASFLAGVAAANCSVGIVHAFAHSIGRDGVPHGLANAIALESGIAFNGETVQMSSLLKALSLSTVGELRAQVRRITASAVGKAGRHTAIMRLTDPDYQSELSDRMAQDVTIRSNPRRPAAEERAAFVASISAQLSER